MYLRLISQFLEGSIYLRIHLINPSIYLSIHLFNTSI